MRKISICGLVLCILGFATQEVRAQAPNCDQLFQEAMQQCQISAMGAVGDGKCILFKVGAPGDTNALADALRCLADQMAFLGCKEAKGVFGGVTVMWGDHISVTNGDCEISIATSVTKEAMAGMLIFSICLLVKIGWFVSTERISKPAFSSILFAVFGLKKYRCFPCINSSHRLLSLRLPNRRKFGMTTSKIP